ncbi:hypothetical protein [Enterovibrio norvegicus]|uniref:hypothetical protein n=1 Tax=Enterovibrio norvegicus TaxID=188144 RepID=UPI00352CC4A2
MMHIKSSQFTGDLTPSAFLARVLSPNVRVELNELAHEWGAFEEFYTRLTALIADVIPANNSQYQNLLVEILTQMPSWWHEAIARNDDRYDAYAHCIGMVLENLLSMHDWVLEVKDHESTSDGFYVWDPISEPSIKFIKRHKCAEYIVRSVNERQCDIAKRQIMALIVPHLLDRSQLCALGVTPEIWEPKRRTRLFDLLRLSIRMEGVSSDE